MCDCFFFFGLCKHQTNCQNDHKKTLLTVNHNDYYDTTTTAVAGDQLHNPTAAMTLILKSWLNGHRLRYLTLFICSPLLIPIVCAILPFLCAAEVCFRLCRGRRLKSPPPQPPLPSPVPPPIVKTELSLLDRYLDDQLELAIEILDECGGELGLGYDYDYIDDFDCNRTNSLC